MNKQKNQILSVNEQISNKNKLSIEKEIVLKAEELLGDRIRIITLSTQDEDIQYLQDSKTLIYKILDLKQLERTIVRELSDEEIYLKSEQLKDLAKAMSYKAFAKTIPYDDVKNNILVNNGIIKITNNKLEFKELEEYELHLTVALKRINIEYKEDLHKEDNPVINKFFSDIMCDDEELVKFLWYSLATPFIERTKYEKAFVFYGETGANGKSVLAKLMESVYGKRNITSVELAEMKDYNLAIMDRGFINWVQDLEKYDSWPNFKKVVSGESIIVNQKYMDPVEKEITSQLFINSNILPKLGNARDGGFTRRLEFIPFNRTFVGAEKDSQIITKLTTTENLEWVLSKLINITKELIEDKAGSWFKDNQPEAVKKLTRQQSLEDSTALSFEEWLLDNIYVSNFEYKLNAPELIDLYSNDSIGEIHHVKGHILYRGRVYQIYKQYCSSEGTHPLSKQNFEKHLKGSTLELFAEDRVSKSKGYYVIKGKEENE